MRPLPSVISSVVLCGLLTAGIARAEKPRMHYPLDHRAPVGKVAHWNVLARPSIHAYPQPVRITVPGTAKVTFFDGSSPSGVTVDAPGQTMLPVGYAYRVRISDMSEYPGVELFPSVEVLDRLHPPANLVEEYPIPIELTADEIEAILDDRMVTKVVYMEKQDLPRPPQRRSAVSLLELPPHANLLESATQMGRPMAILRVGGRTLTEADRELLSAPPVPVQMTQATRQTP